MDDPVKVIDSEKLLEELLNDYPKEKILTFRDMSHLSYFGGAN